MRRSRVEARGFKRNGFRRIAIDFSENSFCYFKFIADKYQVSFSSVVRLFCDGYIEADREMGFDEMGIEEDIRKALSINGPLKMKDRAQPLPKQSIETHDQFISRMLDQNQKL